MSSNALFAPSNSRNQQKHLVEFKAGKMHMKGNMVHPDKKKGLLYVYQSDDALMHLCWKDRQTGNVEDDLIIFPDDCEFKRVPECTTGRVYLLKFKSNSRKFFFWVQEAKTDKDDENCRRINEVLNNPPSLNSSRNSGGTPDGELQSILNNMSQQQLMQLFGGVGGQMSGISSLLGTMNRPSSSSNRATSGSSSSSSSSKPPTSTTSANSKSSTKTTSSQSASSASSDKTQTSTGATSSSSGTSSIQLSDLQNFLSGLGVPGNSDTVNAQPVDLSTALTSDALQSILNNPEAVKELQKYLPSEGTDLNQEENLRSTLSCPQFQQALRTFSTALQSGQLGPVVQQFEVGSDAVQAANQGNMEEFVKALQNAKISSESSKQPEKRKTSDDLGTEAKKKDNKEDEKPNEEK